MEGSKEQLEKSLERFLGRMKGSRENMKAIDSWIDFMRASGISTKTILKDMYCFRIFSDFMQQKRPYSKAKKEEIAKAIAKVEGSEYSPKTKRNIKIAVKAFYKHYLGEDLYYPKQVAWIKSATNGNKKMLPEDILSEEEVLRMIESAGNIRDKAIIALLYDSGIRVGELLGLRKKDVDLGKEVAHVIVNGKTGMRKVPILFSAPYLSGYLELARKKRPDDYLWTAVGTWAGHNKLVDGDAIRKLLRLAGERAGIGKRIYPHLFRHSRATYYANRLTEQQLKAFFGWTGDSKMVSTYVHMSGRDIDDAVLQAHGRKPIEILAPKLTEKICPRCKYENGIDFLHCKRCGAPLDANTMIRSAKASDSLREALLESVKDPEFIKVLQQYLAKKEKEN